MQATLNLVPLDLAHALMKATIQNDLFGLADDSTGEYPHTNICLHGSPGLGKSAIVRQIAKELGMGLIDLRLSAMEESTVLGIPYVFSDGLMHFSTPEWWPEEGDTRPHILFLDELMSAPPAVQTAAYRLILDRTIQNGKKLPDNWIVVAAGNLKSDKTGARDMLPAAANRFGMHLIIDKEQCAEPFLDYALAKKFDRHLIGFLTWKKEAIYGEIGIEAAYATPRTWESVNRHRNNQSLTDPVLQQIAYASAVGSEKALQFAGYLENVDKLPEWDRVKAGDPTYNYKIPTGELCVEFSIATGLAFELLGSLKDNLKDEVNNLTALVEELSTDIKVIMFKTLNRDFGTAAKLFSHPRLAAQFGTIKKYIKR